VSAPKPLSESTIQEQIVELLSRLSPGRFLFFSIPNSQFISYLPKQTKIRMIAKLKRMGMLPGAADLCIVCKGQTYFIEVKTEKGKQSENQRLFQSLCHEMGAIYLLATSPEQVHRALRAWGIVSY